MFLCVDDTVCLDLHGWIYWLSIVLLRGYALICKSEFAGLLPYSIFIDMLLFKSIMVNFTKLTLQLGDFHQARERTSYVFSQLPFVAAKLPRFLHYQFSFSTAKLSRFLHLKIPDKFPFEFGWMVGFEVCH